MSAWFLLLARSLIRILGSYPFQLSVAAHLFALALPRKKWFWLRTLCILPLFIAFDMGSQAFPSGISQAPVLDRLLLFLPSLYILGTLILCYRALPQEYLYCIACAHPAQNIVYNLHWILITHYQVEEGTLLSTLLALGIMAAVYLIFYLLYRNWIKDKEGHVLPLNRVIWHAVIIIVFVIFFNRRTQGAEFELYVYLSYIISDIIAMILQISLLYETDLTRRNELIGQLLVSEQKKQQMTAENVALINQKCHDLKHQIEGLRRMQSDSERSAYVQQIEDAVLFYENTAKTGNETLDLILMEKQLYCKEHGIYLTCVSDGEPLKMLDTMDIYTLFGNALDNAIESVQQEADEANRFISLRVGSQRGFLSIHVENYLGHKVKLLGGLPLTSKTDTNYHGFGVLSIRHIAEKYKGTMSIRTDQNRFRLDILIPLAS